MRDGHNKLTHRNMTAECIMYNCQNSSAIALDCCIYGRFDSVGSHTIQGVLNEC